MRVTIVHSADNVSLTMHYSPLTVGSELCCPGMSLYRFTESARLWGGRAPAIRRRDMLAKFGPGMTLTSLS
jgi:hypothetical protein